MFASSRGFRIHYQVWGSGPALVLLHGFPMWGERWFDTGYVPALQSRFRVLVPDLIGHGFSDKPHSSSAYGPANMAADVVAILDAEGVGRTHVWGYSMGAMVAQTVAVRAPDRVHSLTLGGFPPGLHQDQLDQLAPASIPASWEEWGTDLPDAVRQLFREHNGDFEALRACMAALYQAGATISDLHLAPHPTLAYIGAEDSFADLMRQQAEALPCRLELVPGGHVEAFREAANVLPLVLSHIEASAAASTQGPLSGSPPSP